MQATMTPSLVPTERVYTLPRNVSAIQILPADDGEPVRLGLITQLPQGAQIEVGGPGFTDNTILVRCSGSNYFMFLDDLEAVRKHNLAVAVAHA